MQILYRKPPELCASGPPPGIAELRIIPAEPAHVAAMKGKLRHADAEEILQFGASIQHALWRSYRTALIRRTALIGAVPVAMWGVCGGLCGGIGVPFLLTTEGVTGISPLRFARIYQAEVMDMLKIFIRLENYVLAEYDAAIRLLDICGFTLEGPEPKGENGAMYRKFWMEAA